MDGLQGSLAVAELFMLRIGAPLAFTIAVGYSLRRLEKKWYADTPEQLPTTPPAGAVHAPTTPLRTLSGASVLRYHQS
jgi:hypothetical protein